VSDGSSDKGLGCLEVGLVVLFVLFVTGYWNKPRQACNPDVHATVAGPAAYPAVQR
jgi:hypothetical protein